MKSEWRFLIAGTRIRNYRCEFLKCVANSTTITITMRSLTPTTVQVARVGGDGYVATQVAVDPENGTVYTALERVNEDGVAIDIVRQAHLDEGCAFPEVRGL